MRKLGKLSTRLSDKAQARREEKMKRRAREAVGRNTKREINARLAREFAAELGGHRPSPFAKLDRVITTILTGRRRGMSNV